MIVPTFFTVFLRHLLRRDMQEAKKIADERRREKVEEKLAK